MLAKSHVYTGVVSGADILTAGYCVCQYYTGFGSPVIAPALVHISHQVFPSGNGAQVLLHGLLYAVLFILGTVFPDVDNPTSKIGRIVHVPGQHRGMFHAIWFPLVLGIIGWFVPGCFWFGFGWILHEFWDSFSDAGVCFLYPFSEYRRYPSGAFVKKKHPVRLYRTGSRKELVLVTAVITASCLFLAYVWLPVVWSFLCQFVQTVLIRHGTG